MSFATQIETNDAIHTNAFAAQHARQTVVLKTVEKTVLIVVDMQDRLLLAIGGIEQIVANASRLIRAASKLEIPILFTEHYPKGLGHTLSDLTALAEFVHIVDKISFSAVQERSFIGQIETIGRDRAIICGIESRVCVMQTSLEIAERGFRPFVVADAIGSRNCIDKRTAISRLRD